MQTTVAHNNQGQAAFTKTVLAVYDALVLGLTCHFIWRCPNQRVLASYQKNLSNNHLEVGVGTGFFLDHSVFPTSQPRLALLDLNTNCLERTARRIARYQPETYQADLLKPINIHADSFDSIGLNYVLHCLPGALPAKGIAFAHLKTLLKPGGVLFGATVLHAGVQRNPAAVALMHLCNTRKIFSNAQDTPEGLRLALQEHFTDVQMEIVGCVALFSGRCAVGAIKPQGDAK